MLVEMPSNLYGSVATLGGGGAFMLEVATSVPSFWKTILQPHIQFSRTCRKLMPTPFTLRQSTGRVRCTPLYIQSVKGLCRRNENEDENYCIVFRV